MLFIHALYGVVPDDVIILPHHYDNQQCQLQVVLRNMDREVSLIEKELKEMIKDAEDELCDVPIDDNDQDVIIVDQPENETSKKLKNFRKDPDESEASKKLETFRKHFKREQQKVLQRQNKKGMVKGPKYAAFRQVLNATEKMTDSSVKNLAEKLWYTIQNYP